MLLNAVSQPKRIDIAVWIAIIPFLFVAVLLNGCSKEETPPPTDTVKLVKLMTVGSMDIFNEREFPGRAEAFQSADLSFRVSGPLVALPFEAGQKVKKGDVLAEIDSRDFEVKIKNIESSLQAAQAQLKALQSGARPEDKARLQAQVSAAQASYDETKLRFDRYEELLKNEAISRQEYDIVNKEFEVARATLESAKQEFQIGESGARAEEVEAQQAVIDGLTAQLKEAQNAFADTKLIAPFDGIIVRTFVDNFEDISAKDPIVRLQDVSKIKITLQIPEGLMAKSPDRPKSLEELRDTPVGEASFTAHEGVVYPVRLFAYESEANPQTQTFEVTVVMDQSETHPIQPGMNATVRSGRTKNVMSTLSLTIPISAVFAKPDGSQHVWVVDPATNEVSLRAIETGKVVGDNIVVESGVENGEIIATSGVNFLGEGMKVAQAPDLGEL